MASAPATRRCSLLRPRPHRRLDERAGSSDSGVGPGVVVIGAPSPPWRSWSVAPSASSDEVDDGEEPDPHDVDEVPVVRHDDRGGGLGGGELAELGADEQEDERDEPTDDVQAVEAGG